MSPIEYNRKLDRIISLIETENKPFRRAVQTVHTQRITRVFDNGEKADGGKIGQYSTKPIYVSAKTYGFSFAGQGKNQARRSKDSPRKTKYFAEGYKGFRQFVKRPVNFINLGLTYDLRFDLSNSSSRRVNMPDKVSPHEYHERLKRPHNIEKVDGLENRFGNIFGFSQKERDDFGRIVQVELTNLMK